MTQEEFDGLTFPCCLMVAWSSRRPVPALHSPLAGLYKVDNTALDLGEMVRAGMRYPSIRLCLDRKEAQRIFEHATENEDYLATMGISLESRHLMNISRASDSMEYTLLNDRALLNQENQ